MIKISNNKFDNINFIDFEVSQLLNHDLNTEKFNTSMFEGILNYLSFDFTLDLVFVSLSSFFSPVPFINFSASLIVFFKSSQ